MTKFGGGKEVKVVGQLDTDSEALTVQVLEREVVLLGPRVAIALSATAALETARRLADAAMMATIAETQAAQPLQTFSPDE